MLSAVPLVQSIRLVGDAVHDPTAWLMPLPTPTNRSHRLKMGMHWRMLNPEQSTTPASSLNFSQDFGLAKTKLQNPKADLATRMQSLVKSSFQWLYPDPYSVSSMMVYL